MIVTSILIGGALAGIDSITVTTCTSLDSTCTDSCEDVGDTCSCETVDYCDMDGINCGSWGTCADVVGIALGECTGSAMLYTKYECTDAGGGGVACFSPNSGVETMDGVIPMSDLHAGDHVRTGKDSFSEVVGFIHRDLEAATRFLRFNDLFEVSDYHLVETVEGYSHAIDVKLGMELLTVDGPVEVTSIDAVTRNGYIAPLTKSGTIAVDGFMASNYAHVPANLHWLADLMMWPRKCFTYESESTMDSYSYYMDAILHPPFKALHGGYASF